MKGEAPFKTIEEVEHYLRRNVTSCATSTDRFMAKCFPLMMRMFQEGLKQKKKPKTSEWIKFISVEMKAGKTIKECAEKWKFIKADKAQQAEIPI